MPTQIKFPLSTSPGQTHLESAGRLINCYAEPLGAEAGAKQSWKRCPGLTQFAVTGYAGYRGSIYVNGLLYVALTNELVTVSSGAVVTVIGTLSGTDPVIFAHDNAVPVPDIIAVCAAGAFTISASSVAATGFIYFSGNPVASSTIILGGSTVTFVASGATGLQVNLGANQAATLSNLYALLKGSADANLVKFTYGISGSNLTLQAATPGTGGNALTVVASTTSTGQASAATLSGGLSSGIASYNAGGNLPAVNSVTFQDGYFFFTTGNRQIWASLINSTAVNALTYITMEGRPTDSGVRAVPYKGMLLGFTSSSCEIWQDTAQPFPGFPYSRLAVLDRGLLSAYAIAGMDEAFGQIAWVADDFSVYTLTGLFQPQKISPPQLDRMIYAQAQLNSAQLYSGCYIVNGRSVWTLSSPTWTWEYSFDTQKWNERSSYYSGLLSRWRGIGGTKAYGYWFVGDDQTGNLCYVDPTNYSENGGTQLYRIESGPAVDFPNRVRVGRIDLDFVTGVGLSNSSLPNSVSPIVMISWSDDGGSSYVGGISRSLGQQADSDTRVWATGLGRSGAMGRRWRFDVTDPVYVGFLGGTMDANPRNH